MKLLKEKTTRVKWHHCSIKKHVSTGIEKLRIEAGDACWVLRQKTESSLLAFTRKLYILKTNSISYFSVIYLTLLMQLFSCTAVLFWCFVNSVASFLFFFCPFSNLPIARWICVKLALLLSSTQYPPGICSRTFHADWAKHAAPTPLRLDPANGGNTKSSWYKSTNIYRKMYKVLHVALVLKRELTLLLIKLS